MFMCSLSLLLYGNQGSLPADEVGFRPCIRPTQFEKLVRANLHYNSRIYEALVGPN
jgi:hypothetical protein